MNKLALVVTALVAVCTQACTEHSHAAMPEPGPDATDAASFLTTPCQAACNELAALGCPEKSIVDCATILAHVEADRLVRTSTGDPMTCVAVAGATSVTAERALGVCQVPQ